MANSTSVWSWDQPAGRGWSCRMTTRASESMVASRNAWRSSGSSCARRSASRSGTGTRSAPLEARAPLELGVGHEVDGFVGPDRLAGSVRQDLDEAIGRVDAGDRHDLRAGDSRLAVGVLNVVDLEDEDLLSLVRLGR